MSKNCPHNLLKGKVYFYIMRTSEKKIRNSLKKRSERSISLNMQLPVSHCDPNMKIQFWRLAYQTWKLKMHQKPQAWLTQLRTTNNSVSDHRKPPFWTARIFEVRLHMLGSRETGNRPHGSVTWGNFQVLTTAPKPYSYEVKLMPAQPGCWVENHSRVEESDFLNEKKHCCQAQYKNIFWFEAKCSFVCCCQSCFFSLAFWSKENGTRSLTLAFHFHVIHLPAQYVEKFLVCPLRIYHQMSRYSNSKVKTEKDLDRGSYYINPRGEFE